MEGLNQYCTKANELQKEIKEKYKNSPEKLKISDNYDI